MKAIFLTNNKGNIDYVYGDKNINKIASMTDLDTEVYCEEDIIKNPEKYKDVEYIFSTWGMPGGGEIKLTEHIPLDYILHDLIIGIESSVLMY